MLINSQLEWNIKLLRKDPLNEVSFISEEFRNRFLCSVCSGAYTQLSIYSAVSIYGLDIEITSRNDSLECNRLLGVCALELQVQVAMSRRLIVPWRFTLATSPTWKEQVAEVSASIHRTFSTPFLIPTDRVYFFFKLISTHHFWKCRRSVPFKNYFIIASRNSPDLQRFSDCKYHHQRLQDAIYSPPLFFPKFFQIVFNC